MRRPVIAANWKMNMTQAETRSFAREFLPLVKEIREREIVLCPPFTALAAAVQAFVGSGLAVGAQNLYWQEEGAYTGEVSAPMLKESGCTHVIIGHSERRQYWGETDANVNLKLKAALKHDLTPLFCLGETLAQRQAGAIEAVCAQQLEQGLAGIEAQELTKIIVAYEPIWAIGTGRTATPADAQAAIAFIRGSLLNKYGAIANQTRILYGGSVSPANIQGLMAQEDIDGALVGGASLKPRDFAAICALGAL